MARRKEFTRSIDASSEEFFDNTCSPCAGKGRTKEAKHFCVDCGSYFCDHCLDDHNKFPALKSHQIVDKAGKLDGKKKEEKDLPTERCKVHHGKLVDMYCGDHDEVCCAACIAIKHRSCINVDYLPDIAQGVKKSKEFKHTQVSMKQALQNLFKERDRQKGNLTSLDQDKETCLRDVKRYETDLIQKIKELSQTTERIICSKYDASKSDIQSDIDMLGTKISEVGTVLQTLESNNEAQLFTNLKANKVSIKDCNAMSDTLSRQGKQKLQFTRNKKLIKAVDDLGEVSCIKEALKSEASSGVVPESLENVKSFEATLFGKFSVTSNFGAVTGACAMDDGTYLISDNTHNQVKWLDRDFSVKDEISVDNYPYSIQRIGPKEAIVLLLNDSVIFVTVQNKLSITSSFSAPGIMAAGPYGTGDEIFLVKKSELCICKKNGEELKTFQNMDICYSHMNTQTAVSEDMNTIYLATGKGGLLAVTRDGKTQWKFQDPELETAWGVCTLPGGITIVSGYNSNNVIQVDRDGKKIGVLLGASENFKCPLALAFDRHTNRLLVGYKSNTINVYTLSKLR